MPSRPTSVIRASCDGRVVENVRLASAEPAKPARLVGDRRKDIVLRMMGESGWECGLRVCAIGWRVVCVARKLDKAPERAVTCDIDN